MHLHIKHKKLGIRFYFYSALVWTAVILILSLLSAAKMKELQVVNIIGMDKAGHIFFYVILSFLWAKATGVDIKSQGLIIFLCISFGFFLEILQFYLSIGRTFDFYDGFANVIGVFIGIFLFNKTLKTN
ncbi:MAG: VanZ family protein [Saprospiraceae bacterium]|nr:VanZ family protein [Saprospiraceae bacterium]MBP6695819.1 VanZ family protein [Saprospiraceae bacterium]